MAPGALTTCNAALSVKRMANRGSQNGRQCLKRRYWALQTTFEQLIFVSRETNNRGEKNSQGDIQKYHPIGLFPFGLPESAGGTPTDLQISHDNKVKSSRIKLNICA